LNAAELQSALIAELTNDAELKAEIRRLRELVSQLGVTLQSLSAAVAEPRPTVLPYAAKDFIADLQKKIAHEFPEKRQAVKWEVLPADGMLNIDPELTEWAAEELFRNAFRHDPAGDEVQVQALVEGDWFTFSIREAKKEEIDPAQWTQPLQNLSHGRYGLGLRRARRIIAAQDGELTAKFDPASRTLTSTIRLPCSTESP
jgi:K+-sensing histidine kinase KdpD